MSIRFHPHALERMAERGATQQEVIATVTGGKGFPVKFGRQGFRRNFAYQGQWRGKRYANKQVEVIAVQEKGDWLVISVMVKYH